MRPCAVFILYLHSYILHFSKFLNDVTEKSTHKPQRKVDLPFVFPLLVLVFQNVQLMEITICMKFACVTQAIPLKNKKPILTSKQYQI